MILDLLIKFLFQFMLCPFLKSNLDENTADKKDDTRQVEEEAVNANTSLKERERGGEQNL